MPFCTDCGNPLATASDACPRCGAAGDAPPAAMAPPQMAAPPQWSAPPPASSAPPTAGAWNAAAPPPEVPPQGWNAAVPQQGAPPQDWNAAVPPQGAPPQGWNAAVPQQGTPPQAWNAVPPQGTPPQAWNAAAPPQGTPPAAPPQGLSAPPSTPQWNPASPPQFTPVQAAPSAPPPQSPLPATPFTPVQPQGVAGQAPSAPPSTPQWNAAPPPQFNAPPQFTPPTPPGHPQWQAGGAHGNSLQINLQRTLADIRSFNFKWIVPVDTALSPALLRNPNVWIMLLFGFYPLLAIPLQLMKQLPDVVLTVLVYCALAWSGYFYYFVCKRSVDFKIGGGVMLFTAFIGIRLVFVLWSLPPFTYIAGLKAPDRDLISHVIGYTLGVGIIEEFTKALPVLILAYAMNKVEKPIDGIFFGAMSGLGFAIPEGVQYITGQNATIVDVLIRATTLPFMHALWAGTVGYFIGLAQINKSRGPALIVMGFAVGVVGHGVYDALGTSGNILALGVAALSYLLFAAYLERSQQMIEELQRAERRGAREENVQQIFRQTYLPSLQGAMPQQGAPGGPPPPPS